VCCVAMAGLMRAKFVIPLKLVVLETVKVVMTDLMLLWIWQVTQLVYASLRPVTLPREPGLVLANLIKVLYLNHFDK